MAEWGPGWWEPYASGEVVPFNPEAIAVAARALAVLVGDGRSYDEDPDMREAFAESARVAVGVYLEQADKKLVALEIRDAREAGFAAVSEDLGRTPTATRLAVWRAVRIYQEATERAVLGDDAAPFGEP